MRDQHFTCHLCPAAHNHRFYKHLDDLLQHLSSTHFLCTMCLNAQMASSTGLTDHGAGVVAFKRQGEYAEHMLSAHNIKSASSGYSSLSSHIQASFSVKSANPSTSSSTPGYLDLQFSSSNPYDITPEAPPSSNRHQQSQNRPRHTSPDSTSIPVHSSETRDEFPPPQNQYPSLGSSSRSSNDAAGQSRPSTAASTSGAHPLSLTHKIAERKRAAAALKEEETRQRELQKAFEARRELRNSAFADALGLGNKSLMQTVHVSATVGGGNMGAGSSLNDETGRVIEETGTSDVAAIEQHVYDSLAKVPLFFEIFRPENPQGLVHPSAALGSGGSGKINQLMQILRKPLYSTELIAWAKNHRADLLKVEKKIQDLLSDETATSCQLKPMKKWSLESIHMLAKYYRLNSQQFFSTNSKHQITQEKEGVAPAPTQYLSLIKTADSGLPATLLSSAALPYTQSSQYSQSGASPPQVELQELLRVRESLDILGVLHPTLYFLINTKKYGAGTTVGDFICQIKSLVETKKQGGLSSAAPAVDPDDRIIELVCIGNGLVKVSLNTFCAASRLLDVVTSCGVAAVQSSQIPWESPHDVPPSQLLNISLAEKFFISAHFSEEDIAHASFMDEQVEEEFRTKKVMSSVTDSEVKEVDEGHGKDDNDSQGEMLEDWESYTPEDVDRVCQSLQEKQTAMQKLEAKQKRESTTLSGTQYVASSSRPDVPARQLLTLSHFTRQRLPSPPPKDITNLEDNAHDLPPGFTSVNSSNSSSKGQVKTQPKGKISVHKPSTVASPANNLEDITNGEVLDEAESNALKVAIAASLRDAELHEAQKQYEHLKLAPRSLPPPTDSSHAQRQSEVTPNLKPTDDADSSALSLFGRSGGLAERPGVYRAPRGVLPSASNTTSQNQVTASHDEVHALSLGAHLMHDSQGGEGAEIESLREPIVVPQQLKQSITYPVRFTYDRKNHRQEMQNAFSVLQNGEIDTYYRSDDENENDDDNTNDATLQQKQNVDDAERD